MLFTSQSILRGFAVLGLGLAIMLSGCEGEKNDPTGAEEYFSENPYEPAERGDVLLTISPASAKINIVGQEVIFTVAGGDGAYRWYLANESNGELNSHGANQCAYKCKKVGNNTITVQDESGHYAAAQITPETDTMTVTPSSVTLSGGARYVSFSVKGGTAPYTWIAGNAQLGTVSYSASASYTAAYTAVANAHGENTVTVRDAEGRTAVATVKQQP